MSHAPDSAAAPDTFEAEARVTLFGYAPRAVRVLVRPRPRRWRMVRAARIAGGALLVAPLVAVVPPHAPWVIGVLGMGGILARRRWNERFTVEGVVGACPKCDTGFAVPRGRLRQPHPLPCETCHHESALEIEAAALAAHADETA